MIILLLLEWKSILTFFRLFKYCGIKWLENVFAQVAVTSLDDDTNLYSRPFAVLCSSLGTSSSA
jgi:hypothetical protein